MGIAKVTTNYQVTVPKDVRTIQGIQIGDTVLFTIEGEKVDFLKIKKEKLLHELSGIWKDKIAKNSVDSVREMRKEWSKRTTRMGL